MPGFVDSITGQALEHDQSSSNSTESTNIAWDDTTSNQPRCYSKPAYLPVPTGRAPCVEYLVCKCDIDSCIVETVLWSSSTPHQRELHLRRDNLTWLCQEEERPPGVLNRGNAEHSYSRTRGALDATLVTFTSGVLLPTRPPVKAKESRQINSRL
jgi:hypothetical protein